MVGFKALHDLKTKGSNCTKPKNGNRIYWLAEVMFIQNIHLHPQSGAKTPCVVVPHPSYCIRTWWAPRPVHPAKQNANPNHALRQLGVNEETANLKCPTVILSRKGKNALQCLQTTRVDWFRRLMLVPTLGQMDACATLLQNTVCKTHSQLKTHPIADSEIFVYHDCSSSSVASLPNGSRGASAASSAGHDNLAKQRLQKLHIIHDRSIFTLSLPF